MIDGQAQPCRQIYDNFLTRLYTPVVIVKISKKTENVHDLTSPRGLRDAINAWTLRNIRRLREILGKPSKKKP